MYGLNVYGISEYSIDTMNTEDADEYYIDLTKLVPEFIAEKSEIRDLYIAQGYEIGSLYHAMEDIISQCFIATATWGLARWEELFGLKTNLLLTYEQRREVLYAKIRGQGTTTLSMIQETAAAFSGGDVDVIEDNENYSFTIRFVGSKGVPRNMQGFIDMMEEIKPAHLAYDFEYYYTTWNELQAYAWNKIQGITWDDTKILKEE